MLAPICLFTYNRLNETRQTLEALKKNYLSSESDLFIFSDGPRDEQDKIKVEVVRQYIQSTTGFKSVKIRNSNENKGLASSIINGVSLILEKYDRVIVLEDDLITSSNFLDFMNQALIFYQKDPNLQSISGYSLSLPDKSYEVNFQLRPFSWGWSTWRDRWDPAIFNKDKIQTIIQSDSSILKEFQKKCGADMPKMLTDSITNRNDSWYVRWAFNHFRNNHYAIFPAYSFISNIGHNDDATHCKGINTYISVPVNQNKREFNFPLFQPPDQQSSKEFLSYFSLRHKITIRIKLLKTKNGRNQIFKELKMRLRLKLLFNNTKFKF